MNPFSTEDAIAFLAYGYTEDFVVNKSGLSVYYDIYLQGGAREFTFRGRRGEGSWYVKITGVLGSLVLGRVSFYAPTNGDIPQYFSDVPIANIIEYVDYYTIFSANQGFSFLLRQLANVSISRIPAKHEVSYLLENLCSRGHMQEHWASTTSPYTYKLCWTELSQPVAYLLMHMATRALATMTYGGLGNPDIDWEYQWQSLQDLLETMQQYFPEA